METIVVVDHCPFQLSENGRWVANFQLEFHDNLGVTDQQCFEPEPYKSFATREEAIERNRDLVRAWQRKKGIWDLKLLERNAMQELQS